MDIVKIITEYCEEIREYLKDEIQKSRTMTESIVDHVNVIQDKMFITLQMYSKLVSDEMEKKENFSKVLNISANFFAKEVCEKYKLGARKLRDMDFFKCLLINNADPEWNKNDHYCPIKNA